MLHGSIHLLATVACALLVTGCGGSRTAAPVDVAPRSAPSRAVAERVAVLALRPPERFVLDGRIDEWPPLEPTINPATPPRAPRGKSDREPPDPLASARNPHGASSRVAVALRGDVVLLAAQLSAAAAEGVWLGVGSRAAATAPVGVSSMWRMTHPFDCEHEQVEVGEGHFDRGPELAPDVAAACREKIARHDAFLAAHRARFTRRFHVSRDGIVGFDGDHREPIAGATWRARPRDDGGVVFEATLPLTAMPRFAEAPIRHLRMTARPASEPPTDVADGPPWVWVDVPAARAVAPIDALRAAAFRALDGETFYPSGASHDPAEPELLETVRYVADRRDEVGPDVRRFYETKGALGDVEVGVLHALGDWLVVSTRSAPPNVVVEELGLAPMDLVRPPELRGVVRRGDELHAFFVTPRKPAGGWGSEGLGWTVIAVRADGTLRTDLVDERGEPPWWTEVTCTANADFTTLVTSGPSRWADGEGRYAADPVNVRVELTWDAKTGAYRTTRRTPTPATDRVAR